MHARVAAKENTGQNSSPLTTCIVRSRPSSVAMTTRACDWRASVTGRGCISRAGPSLHARMSPVGPGRTSPRGKYQRLRRALQAVDHTPGVQSSLHNGMMPCSDMAYPGVALAGMRLNHARAVIMACATCRQSHSYRRPTSHSTSQPRGSAVPSQSRGTPAPKRSLRSSRGLPANHTATNLEERLRVQRGQLLRAPQMAHVLCLSRTY